MRFGYVRSRLLPVRYVCFSPTRLSSLDHCSLHPRSSGRLAFTIFTLKMVQKWCLLLDTRCRCRMAASEQVSTILHFLLKSNDVEPNL